MHAKSELISKGCPVSASPPPMGREEEEVEGSMLWQVGVEQAEAAWEETPQTGKGLVLLVQLLEDLGARKRWLDL